ncbi:MAG: DUF1573 domain-containing protein [Ignavibacteria bacterium]|nr:DUF1573 domain-containing protein [Ignavibacteria bacterium]
MKYFATIICILLTSAIGIGQIRVKVIGGDTHHFGTIYKGQKVKHVFEIENLTSKTIQVDKVETSCGCTAALISNKTLKPKQKAKVTAEFDSESFQGYQEKNIYVHERRSKEPLVILKVQVNIAVELDVVPLYLVFDNAVVGSDKNAFVQIINRTSSPIKILKVDNSTKNLKLKIDKYTLNSDEVATIEGTYLPTHSGLVRGSFYLETNAKHQKKVEIKFYSNVRDKL